MRTYVDIVNTGNLNLLSTGRYCDIDTVSSIWEVIVLKCNEVQDNFSYLNTLNQYKSYLFLIKKLNYVKAALMKLMFVVDNDLIRNLKSLGYVVITTGKNAYAKSLGDNLKRSNSLISVITTKHNELKKKLKNVDDDGKELNAEILLADVSAALGFIIPADCTLSRYLEFKKIIIARNGSRNK